jgi:2-oxoglutarate/2-oxoacid ferredoxin oxidoreductase subunit alpha
MSDVEEPFVHPPALIEVPAVAGASVSIALAGSGGSGVMTAGTMLLDAAARAGLYGLMVRTSGPQIRGGEAAALLRLARRPMDALDDSFDLLLAMDWQNVNRFADEIPLRASSVVIGDSDEGAAPEVFSRSGASCVALPLKKMAKAIPGCWVNMLALGLAGGLAGLPLAALEAALRASWKRAEAGLLANLSALRAGFDEAAANPAMAGMARLDTGAAAVGKRWLISGNEAAGYGAVRGGVRFVAAYPITPATELLEWMAPALAQVGGSLLQAEDELASVNMIIGAAYGGVPSLTATSGPGLALMTEAIGLAVSAEVPIVVVDVMRGGPSTGIPAKSEQSDLSFAVSGLHGDAPRLVLAPNSIADCLATTQWAVHLAEALQAPAIVLSDQFMGQSRAIIDRPADAGYGAQRLSVAANTPDYKRYRDTPSGISPMAIPGTPGTAYTADGLEHTEAGIPSSQARDHRVQLDKRERKLALFDYGPRWADIEGGIEGDGDAAVITFGSVTGTVREAVARAAASGFPARLISLRLLAPLQTDRVAAALRGVKRVLVVEQNHGAQLFRYLRAMVDLPGHPASFHRPGPLPLRPGELADAIVEWQRADSTERQTA